MPLLSAGTRLGSFEILAPIGAGGMGEVYRARDSRLDRDVAVKILAGHLAREPAGRERFEREARAASRLNHPHICTLHDVGSATVGGLEHRYLVMELVEGETVAARLRRGPLPLHQAVQYAIQIAYALAAAHQHGVVHRDLKPANVMLTPRGGKLLDFGLAHLRAPVESMEMGATTTHLTAVGVVAGTLPYMSPEQLRSEHVDGRSDVFAFGALLYEMITGVRPFTGGSSVELMASVLERETPTLPDSESGPRRALDRLIKNCLVKDRAERWQSARDAALQLRGIEQDLAATAPVTHLSRRATVAFWLLLAAACFAGGYLLRPRSPVTPAADSAQGRFMLDLTPDVTGAVYNPAIAPDGRTLVFTGDRDADTRIFAHRLDTGERRDLAPAPGPDSGWGTTWSTDGRALIYYSSGVLYSIDLATGARRQVLDQLASGSSLHGGVAQNSAGTILIGGTRLRRVDAGARTARDVYASDATVLGQFWPSFLPNGRDFVFAQQSSDQRTGVFLGSLDSAQLVRLASAFSNAQLSPSGHLLFGQNGALVAQRFDASARALRGEAVVIAADVAQSDGFVHVSIGKDGTVVYVPAQPNVPVSELVWFNRDGTPAGKVGTPGRYRQVAMTADGRRLALEGADATTESAVSLLDTDGGRMLTVTPPPTSQSSFRGLTDPTLSRDGRRLAFTAWVDNDADLFISEGMGQEPIRIALPGAQWAEGFSPDGNMVLYAENDPGGHVSLRAISLQGDRTPRILVNAPAFNDEPHISPDSKWLAYTSNSSGRFEVYVQRFDVRSQAWRLSTDGGGQPEWRLDGTELELYFLTADGMMMRVTGFEGQEPGKTELLFRTPLKPIAFLDQYAVTGKGDRFLILVPLPSQQPARLNVLTNWAAGLRAQ